MQNQPAVSDERHQKAEDGAQDRAADRPEHEGGNDQQHQQVQEAAHEIEAAPQPRKYRSQQSHLTVAGQTFSSMRAALPDRSRR